MGRIPGKNEAIWFEQLTLFFDWKASYSPLGPQGACVIKVGLNKGT